MRIGKWKMGHPRCVEISRDRDPSRGMCVYTACVRSRGELKNRRIAQRAAPRRAPTAPRGNPSSDTSGFPHVRVPLTSGPLYPSPAVLPPHRKSALRSGPRTSAASLHSSPNADSPPHFARLARLSFQPPLPPFHTHARAKVACVLGDDPQSHDERRKPEAGELRWARGKEDGGGGRPGGRERKRRGRRR